MIQQSEFEAACRLRDDGERATGVTASSLSRFGAISAGYDDDFMLNRRGAQSSPVTTFLS